MTGTGILILGVFLAAQGILTGGADDEKGVENLEKARGEQNYALQIGGKSYTLDWAAPFSLPLFIGVEVQKAFDKKKGGGAYAFNDLMNALGNIGEPMLDMTMLQGVNNLKTISRQIKTECSYKETEFL